MEMDDALAHEILLFLLIVQDAHAIARISRVPIVSVLVLGLVLLTRFLYHQFMEIVVAIDRTKIWILALSGQIWRKMGVIWWWS